MSDRPPHNTPRHCRSQEEEGQKVLVVLEGLRQANRELNDRADAYEQERLRMQEGGRQNQDQLQDMADKVGVWGCGLETSPRLILPLRLTRSFNYWGS